MHAYLHYSSPLQAQHLIIMILLSSIALTIILIYLLHRSTRHAAKTLVPPGPPGLPLIGNLHQFDAVNLHIYLWQLSKNYGPIMQLKMGSLPLLVVSSAKVAKEVLKTQDSTFCSRPKLVVQQTFSYNCADIAFSPYNDYWREVRKITTTHLLSLRKTESFRPIREDEVCRMVKKISDSASSHEAVNLSHITMALGSTSICRIAFGKRYDDEGSEIQRFNDLVREAQVLMTSFFVSDYFPVFGWVDKLSGLTNRLDKIFKKLDSFYQELIDEHLDPKRAKRMEVEDDILDVLIQLKEDKSCSINLSWDRIKALLMDIFFAGTETAPAATEWTMTALIKAPNVMAKVQAEIRKSVGEKGKVDEDDLCKLPYLKAVVNESMRLYPPVPLLLPRETLKRCTLEGYEIQSKTLVYINAWAIARDPEYWENPNEFFPERFLNSNIDIKGHDFRVIPFGSGRRICPGISMGLANVELMVANLLYSFDWELPQGIHAEDIDTESLPGLGMHKKNALILVPKKYFV